MTKTAADLKNNPNMHTMPGTPEAPVKTVVDKLSATEGKQLQLTTRTSSSIARAMHAAYLYGELFDLQVIRGEAELLMRMAISQGGQGRRDLIDSLEAGGRMPAEYYTDAKKSDAAYVRVTEYD